MEVDGQRIAELGERCSVDMFWDSYQLHLADPMLERDNILRDDFWNADSIVFRSMIDNSTEVTNVVCRWAHGSQRLIVRGLYVQVELSVVERIVLAMLRGIRRGQTWFAALRKRT